MMFLIRPSVPVPVDSTATDVSWASLHQNFRTIKSPINLQNAENIVITITTLFYNPDGQHFS